MFSKTTLMRTRNFIKKPERFYQVQRLHVSDTGSKNSLSGIKATVYGGSSPIGSAIGMQLSHMGSIVTYPHRATGDISNPVFRELRVNADLGYKTAIRLMDFTDQNEIDVTLKHSNVAVCAIGSRKYYNTQEQFEEANIHIPVTIAKAVRDNPDIKRFIYISAAGADPNSPSRMLRTKWLGEQRVREIYPDVTVFRPTTVFNIQDPNNSPQGKWAAMLKMFNRTVFRIEGANGLVQPVNSYDITLAVINALKMDDSAGQVYELGGPHVYNWDEIYEQFHAVTGVKPYIIPLKLETVMEWAHSPKLSSHYRYIGKYWMYPEFLLNESIDITTNPDEKSFEDLYVKPSAFGINVKQYVNDIIWMNAGANEGDLQAFNG